MLIYNTTFHVDGEAVIGPFLAYIKEYYLPSIVARGYMKNPRFVRLLTDIGEGMQGYAVMCEVENVVVLKKWRKEIGDTLMSSLKDHFGDRVLTFSTAMSVIS